MSKIIEKNCKTCAHRRGVIAGYSCYVTGNMCDDADICKPNYNDKIFTFWSQRLGLFVRIWRYFFAPEESK